MHARARPTLSAQRTLWWSSSPMTTWSSAAVVLILLGLGVVASAGEAPGPTVMLLIAEPEYQTGITMPAFAQSDLAPQGVHCIVVRENPQDPTDFPGLTALPQADLLLISVRRHTLLTAQLELIRAHLRAGKPLIGIRTASHAFGAVPADDRHQGWMTFDQEILGGSYQGHYDDLPAHLACAPGAATHPILAGIDASTLSTRKLYKNPTLAHTAQPLLTGQCDGESAIQNVAWTNQVGRSRIFYTSLGTPTDFATAGFRRLLANAVWWALERSPPTSAAPPDAPGRLPASP